MALEKRFPFLFQVVRFGLVGVLNNLLGYLIYLVVTWFWLEPKLAVTLLYPVGALTAYLGHAKYAFAYQGAHSHGLLRYIVAQLFGYTVNVLLLFIFVDRLHFPHQAVQAAAIFIVGGLLYLLFRFWVFRTNPPKVRA